jgi:hypothetical protein
MGTVSIARPVFVFICLSDARVSTRICTRRLALYLLPALQLKTVQKSALLKNPYKNPLGYGLIVLVFAVDGRSTGTLVPSASSNLTYTS